ncbi:MAG: M10 family metallopeptidase [Cyanobacteria bacterium J06635_15]
MAYGSGTSTKNNTPTGSINVDALMYKKSWASNVVSFSFTDNFSNDYEDDYDLDAGDVYQNGFGQLVPAQQSAMLEWIEMFENVSGLEFEQKTGSEDRDATIRIARSTYPANAGAVALASYPGSSFKAGDIWLDNDQLLNPEIGNFDYYVLGHELGHAVGLVHGHEKTGVANMALLPQHDSMEFSIMTYRAYIGDPGNGVSLRPSGYPQSLMMHDIRALQEMYGANYDYNSSDTVYSFSTLTGEMSINGVGQGKPIDNQIFRTIWDGGGIDTYDFSNYITNLSINLQPGEYVDLDVGVHGVSGNFQRAQLDKDGSEYARGHVFNALSFSGEDHRDEKSLIENAEGGSGNDVFQGNSADNMLSGNAGNDTINGHSGNDSLYGDEGADVINGGTGDDNIYGGKDPDVMDGGTGVDTLIVFEHAGYELDMNTGNTNVRGEVAQNFENVLTGLGNNAIIGTDTDNMISTGSHDDKIFGNGGNDFIVAGDGNDWVDGGFGDDSMDGGPGVDTLDVRFWNAGYELNMKTGVTNFAGETAKNFENVYTGDGNDEIIGTSEANFIDAGAGNDRLEGKDGDDILIGGEGDDFLDGGALDHHGEIDYVTGGGGADLFSLQDDGDVYKGLTVINDFHYFDGDTISLPGFGKDAFNGKFEFQHGSLGIATGAYLVTTGGSEVAFFQYNAPGGIGSEAELNNLFSGILSPIV